MAPKVLPPDVFPPHSVAAQRAGPVSQNNQPKQALMDTQFLTNMMKTHVKLMQKQLEDGFGLIANKMNSLEGKLNDNDQQIKKVETGFVKEKQTKVAKEQENK